MKTPRSGLTWWKRRRATAPASIARFAKSCAPAPEWSYPKTHHGDTEVTETSVLGIWYLVFDEFRDPLKTNYQLPNTKYQEPTPPCLRGRFCARAHFRRPAGHVAGCAGSRGRRGILPTFPHPY